MKDAAVAVIVTFLTIIAIGTGLLLLPAAVAEGPGLVFHDALFTAASAVTVTGLIVEDTGSYFSLFGKIVILVLIQFGGLGFMTFSTLIILLLGKSLSLRDQIIIENDFTSGHYSGIRSLILKIFRITFLFELVGAVLFYLQLHSLSGWDRILSSVFHSVSGFCNAGFSLFTHGFEPFRDNWGINLTLMVLIIAGGLGFLVLSEFFQHLSPENAPRRRLSLHTRLVGMTSLVLILLGTVIFFVTLETTDGASPEPFHSRLLASLFQSVTARTAGFNTLNQAFIPAPMVVITLFLMFVGASPGSTGGGIKTSTLGMIFLKVKSKFQRDKKVRAYYRSIPSSTLDKAFVVVTVSVAVVVLSFFLLVVAEPDLAFDQLLFEVVSAFGTVGLSMGITTELCIFSKIVLVVTMFIGRIGPLTLMVAIARHQAVYEIQYPQEDIMIG